jgi:hypothetical protein
MREQFARVGSAQPERGTENVFCLRFDPTGEHLCLATMKGVRVLAWREVRDADGTLPTPVLAVDVAGNTVVREGATWQGNGYIYALEHVGSRWSSAEAGPWRNQAKETQ